MANTEDISWTTLGSGLRRLQVHEVGQSQPYFIRLQRYGVMMGGHWGRANFPISALR
jgi:hypothetical protein